MKDDEEIRRAIEEIAGRSRDLLAHLEAVGRQTEIRLEDLEAIQDQEKEVSELIASIIK